MRDQQTVWRIKVLFALSGWGVLRLVEGWGNNSLEISRPAPDAAVASLILREGHVSLLPTRTLLDNKQTLLALNCVYFEVS
jgi:hypothetical protein